MLAVHQASRALTTAQKNMVGISRVFRIACVRYSMISLLRFVTLSRAATFGMCFGGIVQDIAHTLIFVKFILVNVIVF